MRGQSRARGAEPTTAWNLSDGKFAPDHGAGAASRLRLCDGLPPGGGPRSPGPARCSGLSGLGLSASRCGAAVLT